MHIHHISQQNSILNTFISEIRNTDLQKDSMRFRRNIERIGEILGYEMSKSLNYKNTSITTPLGHCNIDLLENNIVLCSILRAGVPLHNGLLNYFDTAENAFISAYRHHKHDPESFEIIVEYLACPSLENKTLILADPMLATGQSMVATFEALKPFGTPKEIHLMSVIGAQEGIDFVENHFYGNVHLWIAAIDETLNEKGYIVPGLGDAGDLAFGQKL
ncbi:uracil phosphoribosyltransferase [Flaviramulus aquimarinus]|uniref:Uracil phosphoribosyltransferase n=1 Tax=Flaviramulus aquimarinus TaxID=1170456 RepID=A0ABP9EZW7_9FLAO